MRPLGMMLNSTINPLISKRLYITPLRNINYMFGVQTKTEQNVQGSYQ